VVTSHLRWGDHLYLSGESGQKPTLKTDADQNLIPVLCGIEINVKRNFFYNKNRENYQQVWIAFINNALRLRERILMNNKLLLCILNALRL
jgi:hypothetical protein